MIGERTRVALPTVNNWQIARLDRAISDDPIFAAAAAMKESYARLGMA